MSILIAGAGSIGCYVGGCLALAGTPVTLLLRPRLAAELEQWGLQVTDLEGRDRRLMPGEMLRLTDSPAAIEPASLILVTVKSGATAEIARDIARHARPGCIIISLQNGVGNGDVLRQALPGLTVLDGMVPFNVVQLGQGRFHRGSSGSILISDSMPGLVDRLQAAGLPLAGHPNMPGVLWGKLLLNLNNALNALAGIPLAQELADRRWRRVLAAQQEEALHLLDRAGIRPVKATPLPPRLLPRLLRLPNWLFTRIARRMLDIDPQARSSMWEDLQRGRPTEIAWLQGAIVELADRLGGAAPVNRRVLAAIRAAETASTGSPALEPEQLLAG
jgi:2-dehydropantoate 2-reductase